MDQKGRAGGTTVMTPAMTQLVPLLYLLCFGVLLWQAFRVMGRGFAAVNRPRPGITIHPELLDADGRLTEEDLLTVRFGDEQHAPSDDQGS